MKRDVAILVAIGTLFIGVSVYGQDTTTLLSAFLVNLRSSHLVPGAGTAPTLSTCGTSTLATGSNDSVGRITFTGTTACTVTFVGSFGVNAADVVMSNMTANRGFVSAATKTAFTLSSVTDGDVVVYHVMSR